MNQSAKRGRHERDRKRHRHQMQQNARELAKRPRSAAPKWFLIGGLALMLAFVLGATFWY